MWRINLGKMIFFFFLICCRSLYSFFFFKINYWICESYKFNFLFAKEMDSKCTYKRWMNIRFLIFFFFFLHVHTRGGGRIRTNDLRFMRRGSQLIELPLGDLNLLLTIRTFFFFLSFILLWRVTNLSFE
jgi:hypothetical protein